MNARTATTAFIAALLLGGITYVALRQRPAPSVTSINSRLPLATNATGFTIGQRGESVTFVLDPSLDAWLITGGAGETAWPAEPGAVQGALRMIRDLSRLPGTPTLPPPADTTTDLLLTIPNSPDLTLRIASQSLGGTTRVYEVLQDGNAIEVSAPTATTDLFQPRSTLLWRRADLLAAPGTPTDIRVQTNSATLAFKQVDGKWTLMLPVPAPVDPAAMKELLSASLPAKKFVSKQEPAAPLTNLRDPVATITRTSRLAASGPGGTSVRLITEVTIGSAADTAQETFYASAIARKETLAVNRPDGAGGVAWGPVQAAVDGSSVTAIAKTPDFYVSKRAVQSPSADVSRLRVLPADGAFDFATPLAGSGVPAAEFTRTIDGWTNADKPLSPQESDRIAGVLALLCDTPCARVHLQGLGTPIVPVCTLAVTSVSGGLLDNVGVGIDESASTIYIRSGRVIREYTSDKAGTALETLRGWTR